MEQILNGSFEVANVCIFYILFLEIFLNTLWWHSFSPTFIQQLCMPNLCKMPEQQTMEWQKITAPCLK